MKWASMKIDYWRFKIDLYPTMAIGRWTLNCLSGLLPEFSVQYCRRWSEASGLVAAEMPDGPYAALGQTLASLPYAEDTQTTK